MKPTINILLFMLLGTGLFAQHTTANSKVMAAYTKTELSAMTDEKINQLNIASERLCWFEEPKGTNGEPFQMKLRNQTPVTLTPEQIANFNPLLYILPQDQVACGNLTIIDSTGKRHLLIVRSADMMDREVKRSQVALKKNSVK
ncbi:MAG: hypothetical protein IPP69_02275 [Flavobacteriales bacterium]|nr:hypothetical protein [Flavobacteriales bacterium]